MSGGIGLEIPPVREYAPRPSDFGLLGWSVPVYSITQAIQPTAGVGYYVRVAVPVSITISNVHILQNSAGTSENANCFLGVYDSAGTRIGVSADQASSWRSTGEKTAAITVDGGQSLSVAGSSTAFVYVGLLMGTQGTTPQQFRSGTAGAEPTTLGTGNYLAGTLGTGLSSLPTSITIASLSASPFWAAAIS